MKGEINVERVQNRAISSLLDVVEEIAGAVGEPDWADLVRETFEHHRLELRLGQVIEDDDVT